MVNCNKLQYFYLMRLHRPIGIFLLLWPALWALWIAGNGKPNPWIVIIFIVGVVLMRSAGCVINDFADRNYDGMVARTKDRPLVTGKVSAKEAIILFVVLIFMAFGLVLFLNRLTVLLSIVAVLLATLYPFTKRFIHAPQLVLGLAFNWGVPMAFAAQTGSLPPVTWLVFLISVLWTLIYDTQYAMVDRADDLIIGIKSTAILFGRADKLIIGVLQIMVLALLILLGLILSCRSAYYLCLALAAALSLYQQYLIWQREPQLCFKAFLNNHWFGLVVFLGLALGI